jgi:hypothetical protein
MKERKEGKMFVLFKKGELSRSNTTKPRNLQLLEQLSRLRIEEKCSKTNWFLAGQHPGLSLYFPSESALSENF